ncbi:uncharacterized protein BX663DRAFT_569009 [Cokeromyces recurvatus]|uniref:uncharacterized protein n=1 Tax=Cokeromyces recurvatus TaxID=90255 RepID=UPI00221E4D70|nr:uncharacterized protein BX663DRAFT_569009 [Cokeromyces recurvatus]KAI7902978.1 hypothetical protein BX663DRAFT_569009 [Cokeromyces recurvatus]
MIDIVQTITGQVRTRRRLCKFLFFIDVQPSSKDDPSEKCQILFRTDDNTLDEVSFQEAFRTARPGFVVSVQVGYPLDPSESFEKDYPVWQSNRPVQVIEPYLNTKPFAQDPPLGRSLEKKKKPTECCLDENKTITKQVCKYWINKNKCLRGDDCLFQHPTGEAFESARKAWLQEKEIHRKITNYDPNDPHQSKQPHGLRAIIFADWIQKTFKQQLSSKTASVLDVAGGKGEIAMILSRGFGIPTTVVDPNPRKRPQYWYTRLRRLMYLRFEKNTTSCDNDNMDWKNDKEAQNKLHSWPYELTPEYLHTYLNDEFIKEHEKLLQTTGVIVGLHSDQATIPIVDLALKLNKAFAVVPCCVFSHDNRTRRLKTGELVTTTEQQIQYICEKETQGRGEIKTAYLDFEGKNKVVYWIPSYY